MTALKDYLRYKKIEELKGLIGNFEAFDLTLDDLKKMRDLSSARKAPENHRPGLYR